MGPVPTFGFLANITIFSTWADLGTNLVIPDFVKFSFVVCAIAAAIYGAAWTLAAYPPEPQTVVTALSHEKLRQE